MGKRARYLTLKPCVGRCMSIFVSAILPSVVGSFFVWQVFLVPEMRAQVQGFAANVQSELDTKLANVRKLNEQHELTLTEALAAQ